MLKMMDFMLKMMDFMLKMVDFMQVCLGGDTPKGIYLGDEPSSVSP